MSQIKKELEETIDRAVFKTNDPEEIRKKFLESHQAWSEERKTFGGYIKDIRRLRGLTAKECALQTGTSRAQWQAWEADQAIPTDEELNKIVSGMGFGERKRQDLERLREEAPQHFLTRLTHFRPELLAARGVAKLEADLEWQSFPEEVRAMLLQWCVSQNMNSAEELFHFLAELGTEEEKDDWVRSVLELREPGRDIE